MIFYVVELSALWNGDVPSWKYPRIFESSRVSSPGFGNGSKMMVMWTVYRHSEQIGLCARRPVGCVPLTAIPFRLRLACSREHGLWTPQQWACVMFSDESRFSLQSDSDRTFI
ncbi:transposable element Tcb1 transposase [Trichonephila clavipes]|nr:transposable element Tcb1 transposase [Trichonephila clavipes]